MNIPSDWTFKTIDVAGGFDKHVREQLPWYDLISGAVAHVARHYMPHGGRVYDLGCSTGNIGTLLDSAISARSIDFVPIDNSEAMKSIYSGPGKIVVADIAEIEFEQFDVAISFLCLMFLTIKARAVVLERLVNKCRPGGAIIIVDKLENCGGYVGTILSRLAMAGKLAAGIDAGQIIAKEMSLAGIQRPLSESELPNGAQRLFQFGDFVGWIIEKKTK